MLSVTGSRPWFDLVKLHILFLPMLLLNREERDLKNLMASQKHLYCNAADYYQIVTGKYSVHGNYLPCSYKTASDDTITN